MSIETPKFSLVQKEGKFEIREYQEYISPTSAKRPLKKILRKYFESGLENGLTISMSGMAKKHDVV